MVANSLRWVVASVLLASVVGCGQKGPLYLPDKGGDVVTRPGGQSQQSPQSPETAPQPSTQPQTNTTDEAKKSPAPR